MGAHGLCLYNGSWPLISTGQSGDGFERLEQHAVPSMQSPQRRGNFDIPGVTGMNTGGRGGNAATTTAQERPRVSRFGRPLRRRQSVTAGVGNGAAGTEVS